MKLLLIGCGNIGNALLQIWAKTGLCESIVVVEPSLAHANNYGQFAGIRFVDSVTSIPNDFIADVVVLAIKPQQLNEVASQLQPAVSAFIISVLTSVQIKQLCKYFVHNKIIRIMPNIAIQTAQSVNLAYTDPNLTANDQQYLAVLFASTGETFWLETEEQLDLLTPISGSGPAFFILLAELLTNEAIKLGIEPKLAHKIIQQTFVGSASLVANNIDFAGLVDSVTSKKGITEAALKLLRPDFAAGLNSAIDAALTRLREITVDSDLPIR